MRINQKQLNLQMIRGFRRDNSRIIQVQILQRDPNFIFFNLITGNYTTIRTIKNWNKINADNSVRKDSTKNTGVVRVAVILISVLVIFHKVLFKWVFIKEAVAWQFTMVFILGLTILGAYLVSLTKEEKLTKKRMVFIAITIGLVYFIVNSCYLPSIFIYGAFLIKGIIIFSFYEEKTFAIMSSKPTEASFEDYMRRFVLFMSDRDPSSSKSSGNINQPTNPRYSAPSSETVQVQDQLQGKKNLEEIARIEKVIEELKKGGDPSENPSIKNAINFAKEEAMIDIDSSNKQIAYLKAAIEEGRDPTGSLVPVLKDEEETLNILNNRLNELNKGGNSSTNPSIAEAVKWAIWEHESDIEFKGKKVDNPERPMTQFDRTEGSGYFNLPFSEMTKRQKISSLENLVTGTEDKAKELIDKRLMKKALLYYLEKDMPHRWLDPQLSKEENLQKLTAERDSLTQEIEQLKVQGKKFSEEINKLKSNDEE